MRDNGSRKVSAVIPTYNRADYLGDSVRSALSQTYGNLEVIVVDDGSTDGTREMLRPHIESGEITYLYQENSGKPSVARNLGLRHASGEYICFLDSDDVLMQRGISRGVEMLENHPDVGLVCSGWFFFRRHFSIREELEISWIAGTKYIERLPKELIKIRGDDFVIFERDFLYELFNNNFVCTSNVMTRKELLDRAGHFDESLRIGEDCDLWLRLLEMKNLAYITEPLVFRRQHDGSITRDLAFNLVEDTRVIEKFMGKRRKLSPWTKKRLYRRLETFYFYTGYFFLGRNNIPESRRRFLHALRYHPLSYRNCRYFAISLLPLRAIFFARGLKKKLDQSRYRPYGHNQHQ